MQERRSGINKQKSINLKKPNSVQLSSQEMNPINFKYDLKLEKSSKESKEKDAQGGEKIRKNTADLSFNDTGEKDNQFIPANLINSSIFKKDKQQQRASSNSSNNKKNLNLTTANITSAEINLNLNNYVNFSSNENSNNLVPHETKSSLSKSLSKKQISSVGAPIINKLNKVTEKTLDQLSIKDVYYNTMAQLQNLQNLQLSPSRKNADYNSKSTTVTIKQSPKKKASGNNLRNSWGNNTNNQSGMYDHNLTNLTNLTNLSVLNYPGQHTSEGESNSSKIKRKLTGDFSQMKPQGNLSINLNGNLNGFSTPYSTSNKSKSLLNAFSNTPLNRNRTPIHKNEKFDNFRLDKSNHRKDDGEANDSRNNMNISFSPKSKKVFSSLHSHKKSANEVLEKKYNLNASSISANMIPDMQDKADKADRGDKADKGDKAAFKTKNDLTSNFSKLETFKLQVEKLEMTLNEIRNSTEEVHEKLISQEQNDVSDLSKSLGNKPNSFIKLKISDYNEIYSMVNKLKKEISERIEDDNNLLSINSNNNILSSPSRNSKNQSFFKSKINPFVEKIDRMEKINDLKKTKNLSSVNITNTFNIFHAPKSTNTSATGINFQVPLQVPVVNIKQKINTPLIVNKKASKVQYSFKKNTNNTNNDSPNRVKKQILAVDNNNNYNNNYSNNYNNNYSNNLSNNASYLGNNSYISEPAQSDYLFSTPKIHKTAKENVIGIEVPMQRLELKLNNESHECNENDENVENLLLLKQSERDEMNDVELNSSILDMNCTEPQESERIKNYEIHTNPVVYSKSVSLNIKNPGLKLNLSSAEKNPIQFNQSFNKPHVLNLESLPKYDFNDEFMRNAEEFSPSWREGCRKINLLK